MVQEVRLVGYGIFIFILTGCRFLPRDINGVALLYIFIDLIYIDGFAESIEEKVKTG